MFLVILPLSVSDSHLVDGWVTVFRALGGAPKCHFVLVPVPVMRTKAKHAAAAMQGFCASVEVRPLEIEPQGEFPRASNEHFKGAMLIRGQLSKDKKTIPFIWMELDALPIIEGWDVKLLHGYALECNNSGWYGVLAPVVKEIKKISVETPFKEIPEALKSIKGKLIIDEEDLYMEGVGVYPWNFDVLTDRQWRYTKGDAFDQKLRPYAKRDWHNTDLIQSRWRTGNYEIDPESGEVSGKDLPSNPHGTIHSGPIHAGVVLFHGCKDTSLQEIIAESRDVKIVPVETMNQAPAVQVAPATKAATVGVKKRNIPAASFKLPMKRVQQDTKDETTDSSALTVDRVVDLVQKSPKNLRVDLWAKELGVKTEQLIQLVKNSEGRLKLTSVARWLKAA